MTTIFFLRHAESLANELGVLAGRTPGVRLSERGLKQAKGLVKQLSNYRFDVVISSPLERCIQTIEPFRKKADISTVEMEAFQEMDYGNWSGKNLKKLAQKKEWKIIQNTPETFTFPKGESFRNAAKRINNALISIERDFKDQNILIVSHGDIIKIAITLLLGLQLKNFQKITIDPASLTAFNIDAQKLLFLNLKSKGRWNVNLSQRFQLGGGTDR